MNEPKYEKLPYRKEPKAVRNKRDHYDNLYRDRPLSALYPNLEQEGAAYLDRRTVAG